MGPGMGMASGDVGNNNRPERGGQGSRQGGRLSGEGNNIASNAPQDRSPLDKSYREPNVGGNRQNTTQKTSYNGTVLPPSALSTDRNDCEIIVVSKRATDYAEVIEAKLESLGLSVDMLFPREDVLIGHVLADISSRGCLYAVLVTPQNEERHSMTLNILHGIPQEHRNMPVEDAITLIKRNFDAYKRGDPMGMPGGDVTGRPEWHPNAIQTLLNLLAENRQLTVLQYDHVIKYLQERRKIQLKREFGDTADGVVEPPLPAKKAAQLQNRIMNISNSGINPHWLIAGQSKGQSVQKKNSSSGNKTASNIGSETTMELGVIANRAVEPPLQTEKVAQLQNRIMNISNSSGGNKTASNIASVTPEPATASLLNNPWMSKTRRIRLSFMIDGRRVRRTVNAHKLTQFDMNISNSSSENKTTPNIDSETPMELGVAADGAIEPPLPTEKTTQLQNHIMNISNSSGGNKTASNIASVATAVEETSPSAASSAVTPEPAAASLLNNPWMGKTRKRRRVTIDGRRVRCRVNTHNLTQFDMNIPNSSSGNKTTSNIGSETPMELGVAADGTVEPPLETKKAAQLHNRVMNISNSIGGNKAASNVGSETPMELGVAADGAIEPPLPTEKATQLQNHIMNISNSSGGNKTASDIASVATAVAETSPSAASSAVTPAPAAAPLLNNPWMGKTKKRRWVTIDGRRVRCRVNTHNLTQFDMNIPNSSSGNKTTSNIGSETPMKLGVAADGTVEPPLETKKAAQLHNRAMNISNSIGGNKAASNVGSETPMELGVAADGTVEPPLPTEKATQLQNHIVNISNSIGGNKTASDIDSETPMELGVAADGAIEPPLPTEKATQLQNHIMNISNSSGGNKTASDIGSVATAVAETSPSAASSAVTPEPAAAPLLNNPWMGKTKIRRWVTIDGRRVRRRITIEDWTGG